MKKTELIKDVEYIKKVLPQKHKNLFALISKEEFNNVTQSVIDEISMKGYSKKDFIITLLKIFAKIKDTHTTVYTDGLKTPVFFEFVDDGFYPFVINENLGNYLGKRLTAIDNIPLDQFIESLESYIVFDNEEIKKIETSKSLKDVRLIKHITNSLENGVSYSFENEDPVNIKAISRNKAVSQTSIYRIDGNEWLNMRTNYFVKEIEHTLYFKYSRCREDENYPFSKLFLDLEKVLDIKPEKIIVDLRNNQGGNSSLFDPISKILATYIEKENPQVFCLINRRVFSSGVLNTHEMKYKLGALLVGQPTGQGVNHYGEVKTFKLPNSEIEVQYSSKYFKLIEDDSTTIKPDVFIEPKIDDFMSGKDPVLSYCLKYNK